MIVLIIIALIIVLILYLPIWVEIKYIDGNFSYKIKYAFITFYPKKEKHKKLKKSKKSKSKKIETELKTNKSKSLEDNTTSKDNTKPQNEKVTKTKDEIQSISSNDSNALDTLNLVLDILKAIKEKLGKFITSIKITDLYINFQVADLDAYDCALKFGKLNIILGNVLGFLNWNFKVKKKSITIQPKYNSNDSLYDISFKIKMGLGKGLRKILVMIFKIMPILKENDIIGDKNKKC